MPMTRDFGRERMDMVSRTIGNLYIPSSVDDADAWEWHTATNRFMLLSEGERMPTTPKSRVVGVDCGQKMGVAIWDPEIEDFLWLTTLPFWRSIIQILHAVHPLRDVVIIENNGADRRQRNIHSNDSKRSAARKGQSVGEVIEKENLLESYLRAMGITVLKRPPANTKMGINEWIGYTGASDVWKPRGMTSEHARDAGLLCAGQNKTYQMWRALGGYQDD